MATTPKPGEHPLISHKRFRELNQGIVESTLLDQRIRLIQRKAPASRRLPAWTGEEAARVAATADLRRTDWISDAPGSLVSDLLRGLPLEDILHHAYAVTSGARRPAEHVASKSTIAIPGRLPAAALSSARLHAALGAAAVLQAEKKQAVVVAFAHQSGLAPAEWTSLLRQASDLALPLLFVTHPDPARSPRTLFGKLATLSTAAGVPGIPVDAQDPIALYRVVQESLGRARAGGGPALLECVALPGAAPADGAAALRRYLLARGISAESALTRVETGFTARLDRAER